MYRIIVLLFILFSISFDSIAQDEEITELLQELRNSKEDTSRINLLHDIQEFYLDSENDSALYYNKKAEALIDKLNAITLRYRCYHAFVKIYHAKFDNESALHYCLKAIQAAEVTGNVFDKANSYRALFSLYFNLRKKDSAIKYSAYAVDLTEKIGDTHNIATMYGNLCRIYNDMELHDKAIEYGKKGIAAGERYNDNKGLIISMNNLGNCYISLSRNEEAIAIFEKQLVLGQKIKRMRSVQNAILNLGIVYYGMYDKTGMQRIVAKMTSMENDFDPADRTGASYRHLVHGYNLILNQEYAAAENELSKGVAIAEEDTLTAPLLDLYNTLSSVKFLQQDLKGGDLYLKKWDSLNESMKKQEMAEYSLDLEKKYETEAKVYKNCLAGIPVKAKELS